MVKVRRWAAACVLWGAAETVLMLRAWMKPWQGAAVLALFGLTLFVGAFWSFVQAEAVLRRFQELEPEVWQGLLESGSAGTRMLLRLRRERTQRLSKEAWELLDAYAACSWIGAGLFLWNAVLAVLFT